MSPIVTIVEPTDEDVERMNTESERESAHHGVSVRHLASRRALELGLRSGVVASIPVALISELADATPAQLRAVHLIAGGSALEQAELDVHLSVPNLIRDALGFELQQRRAGRAKSPAKARSSRANGAKGGRPKKTSAA